MPDANGTRPQKVVLGKIVNTHGIRGELRLLPFNPDTEAIQPGSELELRRGSTTRRAAVRATRRHKNFILVTLEGVDTMNAAEELLGSEVEIDADLLPPPEEGEAYHFQLIGLDVVTTGGESVGVVQEVFTTAANDVCVVRRERGEVLIPYVPDIVREVDLEAGRLVIEPIPGLLDE
jgi:16S rRNA processing protein RimM